MSSTLHIRRARVEDAANISALIHSLASFFLEDAERAESAEDFFSTISVQAIRNNLSSEDFRHHVAEEDGQLLGIIAMLKDSHLYQLFVAEDQHGRGIGRRLWSAARAEAPEDITRFTVNASLYAVPVYESFGFRVQGEEIRKDGVVYRYMELNEAEE